MIKKFVFGLGTGRCGTTSLASTLSLAISNSVSHERRPYLPWQIDDNLLMENLASLATQNQNIVGDVSFYWLPYVRHILGYMHIDARFICLQRNKDDTINSFLRMSAISGFNNWSMQSDSVNDVTVNSFPKYDLPINDALGEYWDDYYKESIILQEQFEDRFRIFDIDHLNSVSGLQSIFRFAGLDCEATTQTKYENRHKKLAIIIVFRCEDEQSAYRIDNLKACLFAANNQSTDRSRYKIIVIEESSNKEIDSELSSLSCEYYHLHSNDEFSRSKAFNFGFEKAQLEDHDIACLLDADIIVDKHFVRRCFAYVKQKRNVVLPYSHMIYTAHDTSKKIQEDLFSNCLQEEYPGDIRKSIGGVIWINAGTFRSIGGYDERFVGWGSEDNDFWFRVTAKHRVIRTPHSLFHLWHPPAEKGSRTRKNWELLYSLYPDKIKPPTPQ
jgi:hypothetical protein